MSAVLKTTPLINKILDIITDGMLLLQSDEISMDYSQLYGFELKLILHTGENGKPTILAPIENCSKIQEQNPAMNANVISIDLELSLVPEMLANFENTTIH